jgi:hypothetical protein
MDELIAADAGGQDFSTVATHLRDRRTTEEGATARTQ